MQGDRPQERELRASAVLMPVQFGPNGASIMLTKRSAALTHHPGQVAFPGGKVDASDNGVRAAALREAEEEIGLPASQVEIFGPLPNHETVTGFQVSPFVGLVPYGFKAVKEQGEVDEIFSVPLRFLINLRNYRIESRFWGGKQRYFYVIPYGPYYIWGATARMLRMLAEQIEAQNAN